MSIYLICLTTNGGLPILTRKKGECENLPFSTIASLNGFHMFFKSLGVSLYTTYAENWTYVWHDFNNNITVIVCSQGISKYALEKLPDIVYGAFSLFISREEMSHPSLLERLKKESKNYLPIIDAALESCVGQLLGFSSCLMANENAQMLQRLNEEFSIQCGSLFCCLVVGQRIAVATDGWWDLDIIDRQLLLLYLQTSSTLQNDVAVYLPMKSPNLPFSTIASLNGFHMFFKSLGVSLYTTYAENWTYVWHDFNNNITVIVCSQGISKYALEKLPDIVYGAFSLFISREEMSHPSLLERLKKESKNYLPIIDAALESCVGQLLGFSSCLMANENAQMLQRLNEEFSIQCGSLFCCLVVGQRIAVATDGWWDLDIIDRQLLLLYLQTSSTLQNDVAVYLPMKSPNVAYRFITITVSANSVLCVICGTEPSLQSLHDIAENTFRSESNLLHNMERSIPRGLPEHIELDSSIIAILVANTVTRKCVFSSNIHHSTSAKRYLGDFKHLDVLKRFFDESLSNTSIFKANSLATHLSEISDQYWSLDCHKCYAQIDAHHNILCLLFISSIPTHTMKYLGKKVFAQILQEKTICW